MHASKPSIVNTILANNIVGLYAGEYGRRVGADA